MLDYLRDIVESIYSRYEISTIENLKEIYNSPETDAEVKTRTNYKIIYLEEQRKILDFNMQAIDTAKMVIERLKSKTQFDSEVLQGVDITMVRALRGYLLQVESNF